MTGSEDQDFEPPKLLIYLTIVQTALKIQWPGSSIWFDLASILLLK
jgi:hypothetical protein